MRAGRINSELDILNDESAVDVASSAIARTNFFE